MWCLHLSCSHQLIRHRLKGDGSQRDAMGKATFSYVGRGDRDCGRRRPERMHRAALMRLRAVSFSAMFFQTSCRRHAFSNAGDRRGHSRREYVVVSRSGLPPDFPTGSTVSRLH